MNVFVEDVTKELLNQLSSIDSYKDIKGLELESLNMLKERIALAYIFGRLRETDTTPIEFADTKENVIRTAFNLPFDEAIDYLANVFQNANLDLTYLGTYLSEIVGIIEKSTILELENQILNSVLSVLKNGQSFQMWYNNLDDTIKARKSYLELVYRQNVFNAYSKGTYDQQVDNKDVRAYVVYDALMDGRTSEICEQLNNEVFEVGSNLHNKYLPPNHFNCRSTMISLNEEDLKEYGLSYTGEDPGVELENNFEGKSFDNLEKAWNDKVSNQENLINEIEKNI